MHLNYTLRHHTGYDVSVQSEAATRFDPFYLNMKVKRLIFILVV
jgi:hypothetical protein